MDRSTCIQFVNKRKIMLRSRSAQKKPTGMRAPLKGGGTIAIGQGPMLTPSVAEEAIVNVLLTARRTDSHQLFS